MGTVTRLPTLTALAKTQDFCSKLECHRCQLEGLISRHFGIPPSSVMLLSRNPRRSVITRFCTAAMTSRSSSRNTSNHEVYPSSTATWKAWRSCTLWGKEGEEFIAAKRKDKALYEDRIRALFAAGKESKSSDERFYLE
jgi:hypothetical protein